MVDPYAISGNSPSENSLNTPQQFTDQPDHSLSQDLSQDLESTILGFNEIQSELNYRQAQSTLQDLVQKLDLTPQEKQGLAAEIAGLEGIIHKLETLRVQIAAFGLVGRGKSSLLNALLGQEVFATGPIHGVTRSQQSAHWQIATEPIGDSEQTIYRVAVPSISQPSISQAQIEFVDTPGIDEVQGEAREVLARQIAQQADLLLFIVAGDMTQVEYQALSELRQVGKPMILVFNKIDQYPETDRMDIYHKIRDERVKELLSPDEIVMAAAAPLLTTAMTDINGRRTVQRCRGTPQTQDLKLKILEVLHREGRALVALNSMLYAGEIQTQILQRKMVIREEQADRLIWQGVITKAIATALNPVTVVDILSSAAIDVTLILALSKLYGIQMSQGDAVKLLQRIVLAMGGVGAGELLANLGLSSLKGLLGVAAPVTGGATILPYVSVAMTQAAVAGVSAYAIAQVSKVYLAQGATWGSEEPKAVVGEILASLDETSILNRIKEELRLKLQLRDRSIGTESNP